MYADRISIQITTTLSYPDPSSKSKTSQMDEKGINWTVFHFGKWTADRWINNIIEESQVKVLPWFELNSTPQKCIQRLQSGESSAQGRDHQVLNERPSFFWK